MVFLVTSPILKLSRDPPRVTSLTWTQVWMREAVYVRKRHSYQEIPRILNLYAWNGDKDQVYSLLYHGKWQRSKIYCWSLLTKESLWTGAHPLDHSPSSSEMFSCVLDLLCTPITALTCPCFPVKLESSHSYLTDQ